MVLINADTVNAPFGTFNHLHGGHQVNVINHSDSAPLAFSTQEFSNLTNFLGRIQQSCTLVVHDAPSEFQALVGDLGTLFGVMTRIRDDLQRPDSVLFQHGEQRLDSLGKVSRTLEETLKQLGSLMVSDRSDATTNGTVIKRFWESIKARWTHKESRGIAQIRVDLGLSQASLQLVLASIGNSTLGRIEASIDGLRESLALCMTQPSIRGQVDGSDTSQVLEIRDNDGSTASASTLTSASEGLPVTSESSHEEFRRELAWSRISLEDQTALLEELVSLCQQAVCRYCNETDIATLIAFGRTLIPTSFSLLHWLNKLNSIVHMSTQISKAPVPAHFIISEVLAPARELCQAAETGNHLDKSQILKYVESALFICDRFSGWKFSRQVRIIQDAIERGEVKSLECVRRDGGAGRLESRKRRRQGKG